MMLTFVTIVGLALAVIVFLNLLQAGNSGAARTKSNEPPGINPRMIARTRKVWEEHPEILRPRICPLCGTMLEQNEYLLAALEPENPQRKGQKRQAQIYGCPYCVTTDGVNKTKAPERELSELDV
jgi:hypothetical protein